MKRRLERIGRDEIVVLQEVAAHLWCKEDHGRENHEKHAHSEDVMHGVIRVERNAIQRVPLRITRRVGAFDFHTIGIVGTHIVQGQQMSSHQAQQHQWHSNHVEAEEAVQRGVSHHIVTPDQQCQIRTDKRNGSKQVHDHLGTPVAHLTPGQQISHESLSHQTQENCTAKNPNQLAGLAIAAINQPAEHVQVNHDEEGGGTGGVHIPHQPAPRHITHDVFDGTKSQRCIRLVMHREENTGHDLKHKHQQ